MIQDIHISVRREGDVLDDSLVEVNFVVGSREVDRNGG